MRVPGTAANGSGRNRSAVSRDRFRNARARPVPAMYSSPTTASGTGWRSASSTYSLVFAIGRPIGTVAPGSAAVVSCTQQPTVVSVGPYSLISRVAGACLRHSDRCDSRSASPPMTRHRVSARRSGAGSASPSASACAGVTLSRLAPAAAVSRVTRPSLVSSAGCSTTRWPQVSGSSRLVTARSNAGDEVTGTPHPSSGR